MSYLYEFDDSWSIEIIDKNKKPTKTYNEEKIKEINNFYGFQCKNCLFDVWKNKNSFNNKLVQSRFCCTNCKYSYEFKKNKNYSVELNYKSI